MRRHLPLLLLALPALPAMAQDDRNPIFDSRFDLQLGIQYTDTDANVAAVVDPLPETKIDLDDMGIDDNATVFYAGGRWRFGERWSANFTYNRFDEEGDTIIEDSFNFDGEIYPAGADLDSELKLDAYILDVAYSFGKGRNYEWGAGLGLHSFVFEAGLKARLFVGEGEVTVSDSTDSVLAPVPNARLYADYAFDARNAIRFNAGWLSASYDDYDGSLVYASVRYDHNFGERFGVGVGVQYTDIDLEHDPGGRSREEYEVDLLGAIAYLSYRF
jgi:hypothetical protein